MMQNQQYHHQSHLSNILSRIEKKHDITIICAVECGSRAYGLESDLSDYDIRYIYIQNDQAIYEEDYLDKDARRMRLQGGLHECDQVANKTYIDKWFIVGNKRFLDVTGTHKNHIHYYGGAIVVDLHAWDVTFAVKNLNKMNPSVVEWMFSPIVYCSNYSFLHRARQLLIRQNRSSCLITHYIGMGRKYFKKYLENKSHVRVKKYMHVVRCCVMVEWLLKNKQERFQALIQVDFNKALNDLEPYMLTRLFNSIQKLINEKRMTNKDTLGPRYRVLDRFIESVLNLDVDSDGGEPTQSAYNRLLDSCFLKKFANINFD